jgi:hypothetical protein
MFNWFVIQSLFALEAFRSIKHADYKGSGICFMNQLLHAYVKKGLELMNTGPSKVKIKLVLCEGTESRTEPQSLRAKSGIMA